MAAEVDVFALAIQRGAVAMVGSMLSEDERLLEALMPGGFTPLALAASYGRADVARLLLERGADVDATDNGGVTALLRAVISDHDNVVEVLLHHGADASRGEVRGITPLMFACSQGYAMRVRWLLRSVGRQRLNAQATNGRTAFFAACMKGRLETARLLLFEGSDHTVADSDGTTAREMAEVNGHDRCVALIQWWEGELERAYVVHKARRGLEVPATWQVPGAPVPAYLRARAQGNQRVPGVQVRGLEGGRVTRGAAKRLQEQGGEGPCEGEKQATLEYVMHDLAPELYIELMAGFHG